MDNPSTASAEAAESVRLSVVVPCYQDQDSIAPLIERLDPVLTELGGNCEVVLVDDGSRDRTFESAVAEGAKSAHRVKSIRLLRNFGQHPAVCAGMAEANGEIVVTMDSDMQYPPEEIPKLVAELDNDCRVVSGYREDRKDPLVRRLITRMLTKWLNRQMRSDLVDFGSMFRAYDRSVVEQMTAMTERHRFVPAMVTWLGVPIKEIPVQHDARSGAGSRYRLSSLIELVLDLVTGYVVFPLRLLTVTGLLASAVGFTAAIGLVIYRIVVGSGGAGTVSAFALLCFLLGVLLALAALIGEYVGRIYTEVRGRPYYVIDRIESN